MSVAANLELREIAAAAANHRRSVQLYRLPSAMFDSLAIAIYDSRAAFADAI